MYSNKLRRSKVFLVFVLLTFLLAACSSIPKVDWTLKVSGDVSNPVSFTFEELAKMPQIDLEDVLMEKSRGEDEVRSFSGVELSSLLEIAGAPEKFSAITAIADDGYAIVVNFDELTNSIVALKDGGEWIINSKSDGALRLVTPLTPANRWVFQLIEISVNK